jgi:hypothetical protein
MDGLFFPAEMESRKSTVGRPHFCIQQFSGHFIGAEPLAKLKFPRVPEARLIRWP